jgi:hypothetical protein
MKSNLLILFFLFGLIPLGVFAEPIPQPLKINLHKFGPYIGLQRGAYTSIEFGAEYQLKKMAWIKPTTHAAHFGFNYNLYHNVLGYDMGYWMKKGRLNLTYGANLIYRTDYSRSTLGFTPLIGFKFSQLHLQTGYNFLTTSTPPKAVNGFFISLRFVFIQNTNLDIDK